MKPSAIVPICFGVAILLLVLLPIRWALFGCFCLVVLLLVTVHWWGREPGLPDL